MRPLVWHRSSAAPLFQKTTDAYISFKFGYMEKNWPKLFFLYSRTSYFFHYAICDHLSCTTKYSNSKCQRLADITSQLIVYHINRVSKQRYVNKIYVVVKTCILPINAPRVVHNRTV